MGTSVLLGHRWVGAVIDALPQGVTRRAAAAVAGTVWSRGGDGVGRLRTAMERALRFAGDPSADDPAAVDRLTRAALRSYLRYWSEVITLPHWGSAEVDTRAFLHDSHHLTDALRDGRPVVLALPHQGNWDLLARWLTQRGVRLTTIAERLHPPRAYEVFTAIREGLGIEVLPHDGGPAVLRTLLARARSGQPVALVADRDLTGSGVRLDFLGAPASLPTGPAALACATGGVLIPVGLWYSDDRAEARLYPPIDPGLPGGAPAGSQRPTRVSAVTAALARALERAIVAHPADWHMMQPIWTAGTVDPGTRDGHERRARDIGDTVLL